APRVPGIVAQAETNSEHRGPRTEFVPTAADVEPHAAFIAFPITSYVSNKDWRPETMKAASKFYYARLNGERATFKASSKGQGDDKIASNAATSKVLAALEESLMLPRLKR